MKKIKVLLIEHSLPFYHVPTWELLGSHENIDLTVAYGKGYFTGGKYGVPEGEIPDSSNVSYYSCKITKKVLGKKVLWNSVSISLLKKENFNIVIHQAETKVLSLLVALKLTHQKKGKFALWGIGNPLKSNFINITDAYRRYLAYKADAFVFYSELNKKKYENFGIDTSKLFVAKNSINVEQLIKISNNFSKTQIDNFKNNNNLPYFTILTVGRLIPRKKIEWLIEAVYLLLKETKVNLVIIGEGPEKQKYIKLANKLGINNYVTFTGRIKGVDKLAPWFLSADVIVAPSQVGHLATEAHAYGKPLILSDYKEGQGPESRILIEEQTGYLYKHGNIEDLVSKIKKIMNEEDITKKYKLICQNRAESFAGTKIMANGFLEAISSLSGIMLKKF